MSALTPWTALALLAALAFGLMLGFLHFGTLHRVTEDYLAGRAGRAFALQLARMLVTIAVLFGLARLGAGYLLAGALGVLVARIVMVRRARREP